MQLKLAEKLASLDMEFEIYQDYRGRGRSAPTIGVVVHSIPELLQLVIENAELFIEFEDGIGSLSMDNLGLNYIIY